MAQECGARRFIGVTLDAVLSGQEKVPLRGTRFDVSFEGAGKGRLAGKIRGVDYLFLRAESVRWRRIRSRISGAKSSTTQRHQLTSLDRRQVHANAAQCF
jgi:hypothetical protein